MICDFVKLRSKFVKPGVGCLDIIKSNFSASIFLIVSIMDSPFASDEFSGLKFVMFNPDKFSALSNDNLVLVEFSKNRFKTDFPFKFSMDSLLSKSFFCTEVSSNISVICPTDKL